MEYLLRSIQWLGSTLALLSDGRFVLVLSDHPLETGDPSGPAAPPLVPAFSSFSLRGDGGWL